MDSSRSIDQFSPREIKRISSESGMSTAEVLLKAFKQSSFARAGHKFAKTLHHEENGRLACCTTAAILAITSGVAAVKGEGLLSFASATGAVASLAGALYLQKKAIPKVKNKIDKLKDVFPIGFKQQST